MIITILQAPPKKDNNSKEKHCQNCKKIIVKSIENNWFLEEYCNQYFRLALQSILVMLGNPKN